MSDPELLGKKVQLYSELVHSTKRELYIKMKQQSPLLWWGKTHHLNNRGEQLDFTDMSYLLTLYKNWHKWPHVSVIKSVQVGLSELFIASSHFEAAQGLTVMYVLPKYELRNRFVNNRIKRLHSRAVEYNKLAAAAKKAGGSHHTALMHFGRGGIAYAGSNVESEFVEIPVDSAYVDELDRCNQRNLLLLDDRTTASPYKYRRNISNPTVEDFGIDACFKDGSMAEWHIKCSSCNEWFVPDFFVNCVREVATNLYEPMDPNYDEDVKDSVRLMCHKCGSYIDRLQKGEYVHTHEKRDHKSFRISQLTNKHTPLAPIIKKWMAIGSNKTEQQVFYNSILGRAFSSEGAKVVDWMLNRCKRPYKYPCNPDDYKDIRTMGVDVGSTLHFVIRERVKVQGINCRKLLLCGEARSFKELAQLIKVWRPKLCVIDAMPEIHEVATLKESFNSVYSSSFQIDVVEMHINKQDRLIRMDRTAALDAVKAAVDEEKSLLPMEGEFLHQGAYYKHMQAPTRLLEEDEARPDKTRYVWREGSAPDHFFLAEAYCLQADSMIPVQTVTAYYEQFANEYDQKVAKDKDLKEALADPSKHIDRLESLTPEIFSTTIPRKHDNKREERVLSSVEKEILTVAESMYKVSGKIILTNFCSASGLYGDKAIAFLVKYGFTENGAGDYVKE